MNKINTQIRDKIVQTRLDKDLYDYLENRANELGLHKSTLVYYILKINRETNVINDDAIYKTTFKENENE